MRIIKRELPQLIRFCSLIFDKVNILNKATNRVIAIKHNGLINENAFSESFFQDDGFVEVEEHDVSKVIDTLEEKLSIVVSMSIKDGDELWLLRFINGVNDVQAAQSIIGNTITTILDQYNEKLYVDSLTDTYNRRYYDEKLKSIETANGAAMIDIDNFKSINDTYGHKIGDKVLIEVAKAIKNLVRNSDAVVRYGGDEFFVLFWNIPKDVLHNKLEVIKKNIECIAIDGYDHLNVTASIGGVHRVDGTEALLIDADKKLYIAKETKNNVVM